MNYLKPKKFNKINEKMFSRHGIQAVGGLVSLIFIKISSKIHLFLKSLFLRVRL